MNGRLILRAGFIYCSASMLLGCAAASRSLTSEIRTASDTGGSVVEGQLTDAWLSDASQTPLPSPVPPAAPADEVLENDDKIRLVDYSATSPEMPSDSEVSRETPTLATDGHIMTLAAIEQIAMEHNPTLRQLSASASKAAGLRNQVGLYPNPTVGYFGSQLADVQTDQQGAFIEQEIVRGDKLRLNRVVLHHSTQAQLWDLEVQRFRVLTDVRMRYYESAAAQQELNATLEFVKVALHGLEAATQRKKAGEASQSEVLQARIQLKEVELAADQAAAAFRGAWRDLAAIAGNPEMPPQSLVTDLHVPHLLSDWEAVYQDMQQRSPELSAARTRVGEALALVRRQEAQPISNLNVQLGTGYDNATNNGLLNVQIGAPVPVFNSNSGNISAAYAEFCRATHEVRRIEMAMKSRLARASQDYESAAAAVRTYHTDILPDARQTLTLSGQAYAAGEIDFLQMLIVRRTYFESNVKYIRAQGQLAQANARIDGLLLTGGLDSPGDFQGDDGLRGQSIGGQ